MAWLFPAHLDVGFPGIYKLSNCYLYVVADKMQLWDFKSEFIHKHFFFFLVTQFCYIDLYVWKDLK